MKRQDYFLFFALVALLFAWPGIYDKFFADKSATPAPAVTGEAATEPVAGAPDEAALAPAAEEADPVAEPADVTAAVEAEPAAIAPETLVTLTNGHVVLQFSTHGASLVNATLVRYRDALPLDSVPVELDFRGRSALAYSGISGLGETDGFEVVQHDEAGRLVMERRTREGLLLRREVSLGSNYLVTVRDAFINNTGANLDVGQHQIRTGLIPQEHAHEDFAGMINMGVDSQPPAGSVENWGAMIPKQFKKVRDEQELAALPREVSFRPSPKPVNWVAAKNKYFVQILMPDGDGADWLEVFARRDVSPAELAGARVKDAHIASVAAGLGFNAQVLGPGEPYVRTYEFYIGPKNYGILSGLSHGREGAMGFEENAYLDFIVVPTAKILLRLLNGIHDHVWANYGVAIILLTLIVKIVFWPITHKGTESMRRMAAIQPLMAEIREKHKDNPQKMQQAMMALYKEHKINPLGGCLPMLVQIPVFFALFVVLRIAIELRFAEFLWIGDLSAPERLIEFGFAIPLLGWDALNILPLLMTATMIIQMRLSPTAGDPQQQKIMMIMMPAMMLFFLYNFASGLALYWTTQNTLMIVQQLLYKQRQKHKPA